MCPSTQVEVYDINQPFDIPWKDFDRAKAILDNHRDEGGNRFHWKMDVMSAGEKAGWDLWERSSYLYFLVRPISLSRRSSLGLGTHVGSMPMRAILAEICTGVLLIPMLLVLHARTNGVKGIR